MNTEKKRLWRIRIWLQLPKKLVPAKPPKKKGEPPEQLKVVDIYPERDLFRSKELMVDFKRSEPLKGVESNYMLQCFVRGNDPISAWQSIEGKIESILDILSFTLQIPIKRVHFEALDLTPPLVLKGERESLIGNEPPSIQKNTASRQIGDKWSIGINPRLIASKLDERVEAALRWYSKGLTSEATVDKFAFFWIALESVSMPIKPRQQVFFRCQKCDHEIQKCPKCFYSTKHFPETKERLKELVVSKLKKSLNLFEDLWKARNMMFHGRTKLTSDEVKALLDTIYELRVLTMEALKLQMGLSKNEPPSLITPPTIMMAGQPVLTVRRKLTKRDVKSFLRSKSSLKNMLG